MPAPNDTALILDPNDAAKHLARAAGGAQFARLYRRYCAEFRGEVAERFPHFSEAQLDSLAARYGEAMCDFAGAVRIARRGPFKA